MSNRGIAALHHTVQGKQPPLIFLVGPTGVGKSEIALQLAGNIGAEIVSCDALQVYKEISIASDKPSAQARARVPHHLLDVLSVTEDFNVARWRQLATASVQDILARGQIPLIAGGSGLYMAVLLDGIFEGAEADEKLKQELVQELAAQGAGALHERLKGIDPQAAGRIHPNDAQRILRALEVTLSTGRPMSQWQEKRHGLWGKMPIQIFALNRPREELYRRAEARIDSMLEKGLVDEVRAVSVLPLSRTAQKIIGIPEVTGYLKGDYGLEWAKYLMKRNTRHYVKRQLTWFRKDKRLIWINIEPGQSIVEIGKYTVPIEAVKI